MWLYVCNEALESNLVKPDTICTVILPYGECSLTNQLIPIATFSSCINYYQINLLIGSVMKSCLIFTANLQDRKKTTTTIPSSSSFSENSINVVQKFLLSH